jgi:hypothetical protein
VTRTLSLLTVALAAGLSAWSVAVQPCLAQPPGGVSADAESLRRYLQTHLDPGGGTDAATRYAASDVELCGAPATHTLVYVTGPSWCGTGGCTLLVVTRERDSFRVVARVTLVRPPIRALASTSNGCRDLGVWVQGGGIQPGYEAALRFDGARYPGNPTVAPARRLAGGEPGTEVFGKNAEGRLLHER